MRNDGMKTEHANLTDAMKYREKGESHADTSGRIAYTLSDNETHRKALNDITYHQRFLWAGRIRNAIGSARVTTAFNCFVSGTIKDDFDDIMDKLKEAGQTMRKGGGIGYDFSTLRPRGAHIKSLDSTASGPLSFMGVYDANCATVLSAGHRRGAQMGILRVDHPDIEQFITAKQDGTSLTNFNISVGITKEFMDAKAQGKPFDLRFNGEVWKTVDPNALWNKIMWNTWDWAEPGVVFIDRMNEKNNLWYCETIAATNPCAEQPLPPYGACLLGSICLVNYLKRDAAGRTYFDYELLKSDIPHIARGMDNVIDNTIYPLEKQELEAHRKRRLGVGVTGLANTVEILGRPYGTDGCKEWTRDILTIIRDGMYRASIELAKEKSPFPLFDRDLYTKGNFIQTLPEDIQEDIWVHGIRNSHLTSIAPTGTISLTAGNVSSGIEPVFAHEQLRTMYLDTGEQKTFNLKDYAYNFWQVKGRTADEISVQDHVDMLNIASNLVDSSVSKTCNVGDQVTFEEFKNVYEQAYEGGASGCTTFRAAGKRFGILQKAEELPEEGAACYIDPETGVKECG